MLLRIVTVSTAPDESYRKGLDDDYKMIEYLKKCIHSETKPDLADLVARLKDETLLSIF